MDAWREPVQVSVRCSGRCLLLSLAHPLLVPGAQVGQLDALFERRQVADFGAQRGLAQDLVVRHRGSGCARSSAAAWNWLLPGVAFSNAMRFWFNVSSCGRACWKFCCINWRTLDRWVSVSPSSSNRFGARFACVFGSAAEPCGAVCCGAVAKAMEEQVCRAGRQH